MKLRALTRPAFASFAALGLALACGCATSNRASSPDDPSARGGLKAPALYRNGLAKLETGDPEGALKDFERFQLDTAASPWTPLAIYNSGRALEALGRWSEASARYRAIAGSTDRRSSRLQALALYRLSFCSEELGEEDATLASLRDLEARRANLPAEIAEAELPARIAGAYARLGDLQTAVVYFRRAETGIVALRRAGIAAKNVDWLPETLYQMGHSALAPPTLESFETSLRSLRLAQRFLLDAAETRAQPWADRAADELTAAYGALLATLGSPPGPLRRDDGDPIDRRELQKRTWDLAALALDSIDELRARKTPSDDRNGGQPARIFEYLDGAADDLRATLAERPAGEGLTPEAAARQALRKIQESGRRKKAP